MIRHHDQHIASATFSTAASVVVAATRLASLLLLLPARLLPLRG